METGGPFKYDLVAERTMAQRLHSWVSASEICVQMLMETLDCVECCLPQSRLVPVQVPTEKGMSYNGSLSMHGMLCGAKNKNSVAVYKVKDFALLLLSHAHTPSTHPQRWGLNLGPQVHWARVLPQTCVLRLNL